MSVLAGPVAPGAEVDTLSGAGNVTAGEWDALARRGFHLHNWFLAAERCRWRARHVTVRRNDQLQGVVPAYVTDQNSLHDLHDRWLGPFRTVASLAGIDLRPVISVQPPFAVLSEPLGDPAAFTSTVLHQVFDTLEATALEQGAKAVVWPCVDGESGHILRTAHERGYTAVYAGAGARISVEWESFEEYVASRSKNIRRTIHADLAAIRSARLTVELQSDFRRAVPAMNALYFEAFRRRNQREAPVRHDFFEQLSRDPSEHIKAQLTWDGPRLVGTSLNLMTPDVLEGTLSAFTAEHRRGPAYYNDLCYEPIRLACSLGIRAIDLGATALYTKVLRGATLHPRFLLIKGTTRAWHRLLSTVGELVARRTAWKERRALGSLWNAKAYTPRSDQANYA